MFTLHDFQGFNPCFIGTYSITQINMCRATIVSRVLILVLLELTLLLMKNIKNQLLEMKF